jgi:hypothetical protein
MNIKKINILWKFRFELFIILIFYLSYVIKGVSANNVQVTIKVRYLSNCYLKLFIRMSLLFNTMNNRLRRKIK